MEVLCTTSTFISTANLFLAFLIKKLINVLIMARLSGGARSGVRYGIANGVSPGEEFSSCCLFFFKIGEKLFCFVRCALFKMRFRY